MGRPVNKRNFGLLDDGTNFTVNVQVASNAESEQGYILRQRSVNKFLVNDLKTGTKTTVGGSGTGNVGICTLVDKASGSLDANEMSIQGTLDDGTGSQVRIKKLYNRTCRDFNNNRYTYVIQNDSTASIMVLTAI
jgi:hypothetical protein